MENQFYEYEITVIERELTKKSHLDIAYLLDRPIEEVSAFIEEFVRGKDIVTFQHLLDEKNSKRAAATVKPPKKKAEKKVEKKEAKAISRDVARHQKKGNLDHSSRRRYQTITVDYSQMQMVRIDAKTFIYAKLGEDPEKVRRQYLENTIRSKHRSPSQRKSDYNNKKDHVNVPRKED